MKGKLIAGALFLLLIVLILPAIIGFTDIMVWFYTGHILSGVDWSFERAFVVLFSIAATAPVLALALITIEG